MRRDLSGKSIWLVGASTGIGRDLAKELAGRGASLILSARSTGKLQELANEIGKPATVLPLDVTDTAAIKQATSSIENLDGIVYLAAAYNPAEANAELDFRRIQTTISVNLTGAICLLHSVRDQLANREGSFMAIYGSLAGYRGLPNGQPYSATKAALINYAESLRTELHGLVDVKVINSGFVDTRLTRQNTFKMPMLIDTTSAARRIADGLERGRFEILFPKRFALFIKLLRVLPNGLYFHVVRWIS